MKKKPMRNTDDQLMSFRPQTLFPVYRFLFPTSLCPLLHAMLQ